MAEYMNKLKLNSNIETRSINTETMVVSGNLTVKGETIAEDAIHSVIEGAVTVVNGGAVESQTTLMGQVILTGHRAYTMHFNSLTFNDLLLNETVDISSGEMWFYIGETQYYGLYYEGTTLKSYLDGLTFTTLYENGSWVDDSYKTITNVEAWLSIEAKNWLLNNAKTYDLTSEVISSADEAYGILYDPSTEAIRLGAGYYQGNTSTFRFREDEGEPIAVRNLNAEDDGSLVMWDAENYRLVKAPIVTDDNGVHVDGNVTISGSHIEGQNNIGESGEGLHIEGQNNTARGLYNHTEGFSNKTLATNGHTQGGNNINGGNQTFVGGNGNVVNYNTTTNAIVVGDSNFVHGTSNTVFGEKQHVHGTSNNVTGLLNTVAGQGNTVSGQEHVVAGLNNTVTGARQDVGGKSNQITSGNQQFVRGASNKITSGWVNTVFGSNHTITGTYTFTAGESNTNSHEASSVFGIGNKSGRTAQTVIGSYNVVTNNAMFIVGNGDNDSSRSNAFEVLTNGNAIVAGDLTVGGDIIGADLVVENAVNAEYANTAGHAATATACESANTATSADTATKATQDASGNVITNTYATKSALTSGSLVPAKATKATQDASGNVITSTYATKSALTGGSLVPAKATTATNVSGGTVSCTSASCSGVISCDDGIKIEAAGSGSTQIYGTVTTSGNKVINALRLRAGGTTNDEVWLGDPYGGDNYLYGSWYLGSGTAVSSDARKKNSIEALSINYDILFDNLKPCRFKYNEGTSNRYHTGFIAQELLTAQEIAGLTEQDAAYLCTNSKGYHALRYEEFIALNTDQIQKLKARVAELEEKIVTLLAE